MCLFSEFILIYEHQSYKDLCDYESLVPTPQPMIHNVDHSPCNHEYLRPRILFGSKETYYNTVKTKV